MLVGFFHIFTPRNTYKIMRREMYVYS